MTRVETSAALRPPIIFGWHIDDPSNDDLLGMVKMIEPLGISFLLLDLNKRSGTPDSAAPNAGANAPKFGASESHQHPAGAERFMPLGRSDLALPKELWEQRIVSLVRTNCFDTLRAQLDWSIYVAPRAIAVDLEAVLTQPAESGPGGGDGPGLLDRVANLCQILSGYLGLPNMPTVWISLDCCDKAWDTWSMVYELCNFSEKLGVCLKLQPAETDTGLWQSEPVKCLIVPEAAMVLTGKRMALHETIAGYLPQLLGSKVKVAFGSNLDYHSLIAGSDKAADSEDIVMADAEHKPGVRDLLRAVRKVHTKMGALSVAEMYGRGYEDLLQAPMQPLRDNLDSAAYNEFEQCSLKYHAYGLAIEAFIADAATADPTVHYAVYVLGAGRGPLVEVVLEVLSRTRLTNYTVFALDKNPHTMLTLRDKMRAQRWTNVKLLCTDMRGLSRSALETNAGGREVHLVVSELLGPFGDNELAPECLYGFERAFGAPAKLHFIPQSYTSLAMPIHAPQLWARVRAFGNPKNFHTPYTVNLKSYYNVGSRHMECFHFDHPAPAGAACKDGLERYRALKFVARCDCTVHGFAAYFRTRLFGRVELSILPGEGDDLKSWFPMYFPIEVPFAAKASEVVTLHVWRRADALRVWYEWAFSTPATTAVHNSGGAAHSISKF